MGIRKQLETAESLHRQGKLAEAALAYQKVLELQPDQVDASYGLGTVYLQQGKLEAAVLLLRNAVALAPEDPQIRYNYGLALAASGAKQAAVEEIHRAASLSQGDETVLLPICRKLLQMNQAPIAFRFLAAHACEDVDWVALTARAQGECGDWGGALQRLDRLLAQQPDEPEVWRYYSRAAARLRDFERALDAFETYRSLVQPAGEDLLALADLYLLARRPAEALETLQGAQAQGLETSALYLLLGKCYRLAGDYAKAQRALKTAVRKHPESGEAWQLLLEQESVDTLDAFTQKTTVLADRAQGNTRDQIMIRLTAGRALERCGRFAPAFDYIRSANELHRELLTEQGMDYEPLQTEATYDRILSLFPLASHPERNSNKTPRLNTRVPIFIVGMPRSGSTLVEKILSTFEGIESGGESEAMEFLAADYYWRMEQKALPVPAELSDRDWRALAEQYWERTRVSGARITDKLLHNTRHIGLIQNMFPGAPVLYLKRDPRDVCLSIYSRMFPDGHRYACDLNHLAHFYQQTERLMHHWKGLYPENILEIQFESVIAHPEQETQNLAEFCGLEWRPECLQFHKIASTSFTFSEIQVRKPLNSEGIGRWKAYGEAIRPLLEALQQKGLV